MQACYFNYKIAGFVLRQRMPAITYFKEGRSTRAIFLEVKQNELAAGSCNLCPWKSGAITVSEIAEQQNNTKVNQPKF